MVLFKYQNTVFNQCSKAEYKPFVLASLKYTVIRDLGALTS